MLRRCVCVWCFREAYCVKGEAFFEEFGLMEWWFADAPGGQHEELPVLRRSETPK